MILALLLHAILLAEQMPVEWWQPLLQSGSTVSVLGCVVAWFAIRLEKRLDRLADAMEDSTKAILVSVASAEHNDAAFKSMAIRLLKENEEAKR